MEFLVPRWNPAMVHSLYIFPGPTSLLPCVVPLPFLHPLLFPWLLPTFLFDPCFSLFLSVFWLLPFPLPLPFLTDTPHFLQQPCHRAPWGQMLWMGSAADTVNARSYLGACGSSAGPVLTRLVLPLLHLNTKCPGLRPADPPSDEP